jgi:hypothetical protein
VTAQWPSTPLDRAYCDLAFAAVAWSGLEAALATGLRDTAVAAVSDERRSQIDAQARAERLERDGLAPGEHRDAADPAVIDLMADVAMAADLIAELAAQALGEDRPPPASSALADPRPKLWHVRAGLAGLRDVAPASFSVLCEQAHALAGELARAVGVVRPGWPLPAALCPWCGGRTVRRPVGGAATLVVHVLPGGVPAVVCHGTNCAPPDSHCGTWWRGRPAWPEPEWEWLAKWIDAAMQPKAVVA